MKRITKVGIFLMVAMLVGLLVSSIIVYGQGGVTEKVTVNEVETNNQEVTIFENSEDFAKSLTETEFAQEQVDLILTFDAAIEEARKNGASPEQLKQLTAKFDQKMLATEKVTVDGVETDNSEVTIFENSEDFAKSLAETGFPQEQIDLILTFDTAIENARKDGSSAEQIKLLTDKFNQKMLAVAETSNAKEGPSTVWSSTAAGIYASCPNGPRANWRTFNGSWTSYFKNYNGYYYGISSYCSGSSCNISRYRSQSGSWMYHLAYGYSPYHYSAGCW